MIGSMFSRFVAILLSISITHVAFVQSAGAAAITTQTVMQLADREAAISRIEAQLAREDVQRTMVKLGVDPVEAKGRVSALTDAEIAQLDGELAKLPAGADGGWVLLAIVLVLLIVLFALGKLHYT